MSAHHLENLILVVDDEQEICLSLCDFLELEGYETMEASNGSKALTILETKMPKMIISDLMMPEIDGLTLLDELRRRDIQIPVIIMTAYASVDRAIQAMKNGAADFVTKPLDLDYLLQIVKRVIERIEMSEKIKMQQQRLFQSEKMASLGQLVAGLAHEINNPINFIRSNIQPLKEYLAGYKKLASAASNKDAPSLRYLQNEIKKIQEEYDLDYADKDLDKLISSFVDGTERIIKLIADLRLYSHSDQEYYSNFNLHEAIDSSLSILSHRCKDRIDIQKEYGEIPPIKCSPGKIIQVFVNIVNNAIDAIKEQGKIWIKTSVDDDNIIIKIRDNGVGILPENLPKIFDPFFTTKPIGSGTGLGLSISYGIIEQHGGTITVESESGIGATFTVSLPIAKNDVTKTVISY
ncbi:MAG: response regulator [Candidatus Omnitrophota bacterium]